MCIHPCKERISVPRNRVPLGVECVATSVVAVSVRRASAVRRFDYRAYGPAWEDGRVGAWGTQVVDHFLNSDDGACRGEHNLLLHAYYPLDEHVPFAIRSLGVDDGDIWPQGRHRR